MTHEPEITWQDPPPAHRGPGSNFRDVAVDQLKQRPGQWALVETSKNRGNHELWKRRGCEVTARLQADGTIDYYARWPEDTP